MLDIASKACIYRTVERSISRIERVLLSSLVSNYSTFERVLFSIPWHPRAFYENAERNRRPININDRNRIDDEYFSCLWVSHRTRFYLIDITHYF